MSLYREAAPRTAPAATRTARAVAGELLDRTLGTLTACPRWDVDASASGFGTAPARSRRSAPTTRPRSTAASPLLSAAALVPRPARRVALSPLDRPLPTADGLLYLGAEARALPREVARTVGATGTAAVGERLRTRTTDAWLAELRAAGLPSVAVRTDLAALAADPAFARTVLPPDDRLPYARPAAPRESTEEAR
ncbi:hypothetical protein [Streptomyces sp. NPDC088752]|uniref:hypothetical protein n=1 Tax=Streptomyces sp. NPDC088752 TaxID=3154963 RepID=UPI003419AE5D